MFRVELIQAGPSQTLEDAIKKHDLDAIRKILATGVDPNRQTYHRRPVEYIWDGQTHQKSTEKTIDILKILHEAGARIDSDALHSITNHILNPPVEMSVIKAMCTYPECDIDGLNYRYRTPLLAAIFRCIHHTQTVKESELYPLIKTFLHLGADPNLPTKDVHGHRESIPATLPLHVAVTSCDTVLVKLLLDHGADPFRKDSYGHDALTWATHLVTQTHQTLEIQNISSIHDHQRHAAAVEVVQFIKHLYAARTAFDTIKHELHKELVEYVFHPTRLEKNGYFELE